MAVIAILITLGLAGILQTIDCGNDNKHTHETREIKK